MSKEIKNYLHLYLGCEVLIESEMYMWGGKRAKIIDTIIRVSRYGEIECKTYCPPTSDVKLILRPLSSMTEEEAAHFAWICLNSRHAPKDFIAIEKDEIDTNLVHNDNGLMLDDDVEVYIGICCRCLDGYIAIMKDGRIGMADEDDTPTKEMKPVDDVYGKVQYLLSKHFDLFGLIESGLAINQPIQTPDK